MLLIRQNPSFPLLWSVFVKKCPYQMLRSCFDAWVEKHILILTSLSIFSCILDYFPPFSVVMFEAFASVASLV